LIKKIGEYHANDEWYSQSANTCDHTQFQLVKLFKHLTETQDKKMNRQKKEAEEIIIKQMRKHSKTLR
jgi:hypothetical protein